MGDDERFYEAVRLGVADAMWRLMTNSTDMPCSDFYDSVQAGVREAIKAGALYTAEDRDDE